MRYVDIYSNCMFAAMLGDSLGVPFEFKDSEDIPERYIKNPEIIPESYKTYKVPIGTISDDGTQLLMMHYCLHHGLDIGQELLAWRRGKYWTNSHAFDCGVQTAQALYHYWKHGEILSMPEGSGNGSLMRILPVAFEKYGNIASMVKKYSEITHNSDDCLKACEFYCKLVHLLAHVVKNNPESENMKSVFFQIWEYLEIDLELNYSQRYSHDIKGSGYVVDSICLIRKIIGESMSFEEAVTKAIQFGKDADTNASIIAPVAHLVFNMLGGNAYPDGWNLIYSANEPNEYFEEMFYELHETEFGDALEIKFENNIDGECSDFVD